MKWMYGASRNISWVLFSDINNLRGLCWECHSQVTALFDRGFGRVAKAGKSEFTRATGEGGREFVSSSLPVHKINAALPQSQAELDELLSGIPE